MGGCGSGYDCWTLARHGWRVTGLDLSPTAVARAEELLALERARQQQQGDGKGWAGSVEFVCGDFFALPEEEEGRFDLIFDYTVRVCGSVGLSTGERLCAVVAIAGSHGMSIDSFLHSARPLT